MKKIALFLVFAILFTGLFGVGSFAAEEYWLDHMSEVTPTQYTAFDEYIVSNGSELAYVLNLFSSSGIGNKQTNIVLANDIDLSVYEWTPIDEDFSGLLRLRGDGHRIAGLHATAGQSGLFAYVDNAEFYDLTVEGTVAGSDDVFNYYGGIARTAANCHFTGVCSNVVFDKNAVQAGGIIGKAYGNVSFINCAFTGSFADGVQSGGMLYSPLEDNEYVFSFSIIAVKDTNGLIYGEDLLQNAGQRPFTAIMDGEASMDDVSKQLNSFISLIKSNHIYNNTSQSQMLKQWRSVDGKAPTTIVFTGEPSDNELIWAADGLNKGGLVVNTATEFAAAATVVNSGNVGDLSATITLGSDLDLTALGTGLINLPKNVTLDGNGKSITVDETLIGTNSGTIKNLVLASSADGIKCVVKAVAADMTDNSPTFIACGGMVTANYGTISNVAVEGIINAGAIETTMPAYNVIPYKMKAYLPLFAGAFVKTSTKTFTGAFAGVNSGTIENCVFTGKMQIKEIPGTIVYAGIFAGNALAGSNVNGYCIDSFPTVGYDNYSNNTCEHLTEEEMTVNGRIIVTKLNNWIAGQPDPSAYKRWYFNDGKPTMTEPGYKGGVSAGTYTPSFFTLTFETNGGSALNPITRAEGTTVDLSVYTPVRAGYVFTGWYSDAALTAKLTSVQLMKHTTIFAGWQSEEWENPFGDFKKGDWFYEDVEFVYKNGLMRGTANDLFSPYLVTTRGVLVSILYSLEGEPAVSGACPFDDVKAGSAYEKAIIWAAANNIVDGYGNGKFGPDDEVTREQTAAILWRYAKFKGYDMTTDGASVKGFDDYKSISEYALTPMEWAVNAGLLKGSDNKLSPQDGVKRCETAAIIHRFCMMTAK